MKNHKGFSLVEMLAVLMISTVVLVPMMFSLTNNLEINHRLINRNAASLLTESTIIGFDMMRYDPLKATLDDSPDLYVEFNIDKEDLCEYNPEFSGINPTNSILCGFIFSSRANNITFDSDEFRVFVYPYYLNQTDIEALEADESIPLAVLQSIENIEWSDESSLELLRVTVWLKYGENDRDVLVRNGVISREQ